MNEMNGGVIVSSTDNIERNSREPSRREFLERMGGSSVALLAGACASGAAAPNASPPPASQSAWDVSWLDRVRRARHRGLFDAVQGDVALMLAARFLDNVEQVYAARAPEALAVLNLRTGSAVLGLSDAIWREYPVAEDKNVLDPATKAPARRNLSYAPTSEMSAAEAAMTIERLTARGAIPIVCDFALGHLANRLATKMGRPSADVHAALQRGLVPGAFLVPSGIFGLTEAQNAGCAFVPG
jgi:hypothetical protein